MNELVQRLSEGDHPVEASLRPDKTATALKERIDLGYVHIKFTGTRGGTELSVQLDRDACDLTRADFDHQSGSVHLVGELVLNYVKVRCVADIDLATLEGKGHLEPLAELSPADIKSA
ncbi:MbtH domain protein [Pleurocapsales cyanobacterium LEGE 06147]|nr:MbtH domain protein [Pleurocapsales cyanobacterium LEGE 06147]